jgi:Uma2 family endonuclease
MGAASSPRLTFEEFVLLPDEPGKRELLNGELIQLPPAEIDHDEFASDIYHLLYDWLKDAHKRGLALELGMVYHEVGYKLPGNIYLKPDVSVSFADQPRGKFLCNSPAIAIEIVSPGNSALEMDRKTSAYFRYGAREVWRFYRDPLHAVTHLSDNTSQTLWTGILTSKLLPGFELRLAHFLPPTEDSL